MFKMVLKATQMLSLLGVVFLSGCLKTHKMVVTEFPQADVYDSAYPALAQYLRSQTLHDGFESRAHFDALWMSDEMRHMYSALHSKKVGKNKEEEEAFLLRQLEENKHAIVIYVLAEVGDKAHVSLSDKASSWSLYLQTGDGYRIVPQSIKQVDLESEFAYMFGYRATPFKKAYLVKFPAKDLSGRVYFAPNSTMSLICAGAAVSSTLSWPVPGELDIAKMKAKFALQAKAKEGVIGFVKNTNSTTSKAEDFFW